MLQVELQGKPQELKPQVMAILNVTPDSFSDGGKHNSCLQAVTKAMEMIEEGADIIDIGGESTRPGSAEVSAEEELQRVIPLIEQLSEKTSVPISIDTKKTIVMREAVSAGAKMVNDVSALSDKGSISFLSSCNADICLMHMQGIPQTMQDSPQYKDVAADVKQYLQKRIEICLQSGISAKRIIIDPGFGFGKTVEDNYRLFSNLQQFKDLGCRLLVGVSRKSMIGSVINRPVEERVYGSCALAALAVVKGASIIRAHDIKATRDAVDLAYMVLTN